MVVILRQLVSFLDMAAEEIGLMYGLAVLLGDPFSRAVCGEDDERDVAEEGFGYRRGEVIGGSTRGTEQYGRGTGLAGHTHGDEGSAALVAKGTGLYVWMSCKCECQGRTARSGTEYRVRYAFLVAQLGNVVDWLISNHLNMDVRICRRAGDYSRFLLALPIRLSIRPWL